MTVNESMDKLKPIAKHYKVRIFYSKTPSPGVAGYRNSKKSFTINLVNCNTPEKIITCFFHELGHIYCIRHGLWRSFHEMESGKNISKVRRTALKAELWIDKWAQTEMNKWFPEIGYSGSYISLTKYQARKWLNQNILNKHYNHEVIQIKEVLHIETKNEEVDIESQ